MENKNNNFFAVIMAGGVGSRFWPLSRKDYPKQFHDILGSGRTLLQQTYDRFKTIIPVENIFVVTNEDYRALVMEQLPELHDSQVLGEPSARNTAPCIAYASYRILKRNPGASMVVAPSDHIIYDDEVFSELILKSLNFAASNEVLVTLGIKPSRPDTGYGYIQFHEEGKNDGFYKVKTFTEKPNLEMANHFVKTGEFLWNAGIFVWSANTIIKAFTRFLPDINKAFEKGLQSFETDDEKKFINKTYEMCTMISIDYGIMEKAENVYVIPAGFRWSDIGTWNALYEQVKKDKNGNVCRGQNVYVRNTKNSIVFSSNDKLIALNCVENLVVVNEGNIIMVANLQKEQEVRQLVNELKIKYGEKYI